MNVRLASLLSARRWAALGVVALVALAGCAGGPKLQSRAVLPYQVADKAGLHVRWQRQLGLALADGERPRDMWLVGDSLYLLTTHNQLHRVDAKSGTEAWNTFLGDDARSVYCPQEVRGGKTILVADRARVLLLDKQTGEITKFASFAFAASSPPVVVGDTCAIGSGHNYFYGLFIDVLGKQRWSVWSPNDSFDAPPVLSFGKNVIFASRNGFVWSCDGATGKALWMNRKVNGQVAAGLATDGRNLYIPTLENKFFGFDVLTGNHIWDLRLEGRLDQTPMPARQTVLIVGSGAGLYAVSADKGEIKWQVPGVAQVLAHTNDRVFARDGINTLLILNLETGNVEASAPLPEADRFAANPDTPIVYAITRDGRATAIEMAGK